MEESLAFDFFNAVDFQQQFQNKVYINKIFSIFLFLFRI